MAINMGGGGGGGKGKGDILTCMDFFQVVQIFHAGIYIFFLLGKSLDGQCMIFLGYLL